MLCLHLDTYRGNHLLTKPWYICTVFILAQITEVNLSSTTITIKSKWRQILKSMHKMPAFIREAVALVVLSFHSLVLELQTQVSRFQRLLLLQHLKKSRRKRFIFLQIALQKTRRASRAWSPFCTEISLKIGGKENFRISRRTFDYIVRVVGRDWQTNWQCNDVNFISRVVRRREDTNAI